MLAYCTYCSAGKKHATSPLPAIDRYQSERIAFVHQLAEQKGLPLVILSGKYGILETHQKIDYYDHLLTAPEVAQHADLVASQLKAKKITQLVFYTGSVEQDKNLKPYIDCITQASKKVGITLEFREMPFFD